MNVRRSNSHHPILSPISEAAPLGERSILDAEAFRRMIALERKRSERSRKPFMLLLLDMGDDLPSEKNGRILGKILSALSVSTRDTDVTGWYSNNCVVGVMFTEISIEEGGSTPATIIARVTQTLQSNLTLEQFNRVTLSFHVFPEDWDHEDPGGSSNPTLYPDLSQRDEGRKGFRVVKRMMDIVGSVFALTFFSPIFLVVALAVKLTSRGPGVLPAAPRRSIWQFVRISEISLDVCEQRCSGPQRVRSTTDCRKSGHASVERERARRLQTDQEIPASHASAPSCAKPVWMSFPSSSMY